MTRLLELQKRVSIGVRCFSWSLMGHYLNKFGRVSIGACFENVCW